MMPTTSDGRNATAASFSVVIPAHDEGSVIGRCLSAWIGDLHPGEAEVVVVANGCTDDTAEVARDFGVEVVEVPVACKSTALNAGDAAVTAFPRIYLDADVVVTAKALRALADALSGPEPRVAAPAVRFQHHGRPWPVRAFYRTYVRLPYVTEGLVGLGIYSLSRSGRARFADFPRLTADDLFVQRLFGPQERLVVPAVFDVEVPHDLRSLVRVRRRTASGNRQLVALGVEVPGTEGRPSVDTRSTTTDTVRAMAGMLRRHPSSAADLAVYAAIVIAGRWGARRPGGVRWYRDDTTRQRQDDRRDASTGRATDQGLAYLVSMYPAVSHAFIEREVEALEQVGVRVARFSVRPCPPDQLLTDEARAEAQRTTVLLGSPLRQWLAAHAALLLRSPAVYLRGVGVATRTGRRNPRDRLWQVFYFAEAVLLLHLARQRSLRHFHVHFANNGADIARRAVALGCCADGPGAWTWSLAMHGPTEFEDPATFDLVAKAQDAAFVACISDYCRERLRSLLPARSAARLEIVRMGVDPDRFPALVEQRQARDTTGLRVLFVGRLVREKAPEVLLEAVQRILAVGEVRLDVVVIGGGPLAEDLEERVLRDGSSGSVRLLGPVGQDVLPAWYAWADVFCLPSRAEGVPVVLMEAMSSGLPVLTTRTDGIPELVEDGVTGLLVDPEDPGAVARELLRLHEDPALRARLGRAGRARVLGNHSPRRNAEALKALLIETASAGC